MDTIMAVANIAAHSDLGDPRLTEGYKALSSRGASGPQIAEATILAISLADRSGLHAADDRATQHRLAAAIDRAANSTTVIQSPYDRSARIMTDFMLQEAAAARMAATSSRDPLAHVSNPASNRSGLDAAGILRRNGVNGHAILDSMSPQDMSAIAAGRYDRIAGDHARFKISASLRIDAMAMSTPTPDAPPLRPALTAMSKGPAQPDLPTAAVFGRKGVVER